MFLYLCYEKIVQDQQGSKPNKHVEGAAQNGTHAKDYVS